MEQSIWDMTHYRIRDLAQFGEESEDPIGVLVGNPENKNWAFAIDSMDGVIPPIPDKPGYATIGDKTYKTVQIGNHEWLAENLDLVWDGLDVGTSGVSYGPKANYYNDNETTYGWSGKKYGLLYNGDAVLYLDEHKDTLIPGWHVPNGDEWNELVEYIGGDPRFIGGNSPGGNKLKTRDDWVLDVGTDEYGFCAKPAGQKSTGNTYADVGSRTSFWTAVSIPSSNVSLSYSLSYDDTINKGYPARYIEYSVRLVRDAQPPSPPQPDPKYVGKRIGMDRIVVLGPQGKIPAVNMPSCISGCSGVETVTQLPDYGTIDKVYRLESENEPDKFYRWVEDVSAESPSPKTGSFVPISCNYTMEPGKGTAISDSVESEYAGATVIGGKTYHTTVVGNLEWTVENLDLTWSGLQPSSIGTTDDANPKANYYDNDETTYGWEGKKYGLLYNWPAVKHVADNADALCPGWRVPTKDEYLALIDAAGGATSAGSALKSTTGWASYPGQDTYHMTVYPSGYYGGVFGGENENATVWTLDETSATGRAFVLSFLDTADNSTRVTTASESLQYSLRLVRDVPPFYTRQVDLNITAPGSLEANVLSSEVATGLSHTKSGVGDSGAVFPSGQITTGSNFGDSVYVQNVTCNATGHVTALTETAVTYPSTAALVTTPGLVEIAMPDSVQDSPARSHIQPITGAEHSSPGTITPPAGEYVYLAPADHVHSAATLTFANLRDSTGPVDIEYNMAHDVTFNMKDVLHILPPTSIPTSGMVLVSTMTAGGTAIWDNFSMSTRKCTSNGHSFVVVGTNTSLITNQSSPFQVVENTLYSVTATIQVKITEGLGLNSPANVPKCYVCIIDIGGVTRKFNIPGSYTFSLPYTLNVNCLYKAGASSTSDHMVNVDVKATLDDNIFSACCVEAKAAELI